ncbi:LRRC59 family protein [Megaselia abdita]
MGEKKEKFNIRDKLNGDILDLSLSQMTKVPVKQICSLKNITTLDLSNNNLVVIQENFGTLQHLKSIDLSCNQIVKLPDNLGNLSKLIHLNLYNNSLEWLPLSFGDLKKLRYLDLKQNPIQKLPELSSVIGPCFTSRDCSVAAKNTVKYFAERKELVERLERLEAMALPPTEEATVPEGPKKKKSKKRGKKKQLPSDKINNAKEDFEDVLTVVKSPPKPKHNNSPKKSSSAFVAVSLFFLLLTFNMFLFYLATIKYPETFEKILEYIEIESFRLRVTDFVQNFITSPDLFN